MEPLDALIARLAAAGALPPPADGGAVTAANALGIEARQSLVQYLFKASEHAVAASHAVWFAWC